MVFINIIINAQNMHNILSNRYAKENMLFTIKKHSLRFKATRHCDEPKIISIHKYYVYYILTRLIYVCWSIVFNEVKIYINLIRDIYIGLQSYTYTGLIDVTIYHLSIKKINCNPQCKYAYDVILLYFLYKYKYVAT